MTLKLWMAGSMVGFVGHTLAPKRLARQTSWRASEGWQREIALWNIGISYALLRSITSPEEPSQITLIHSTRLLNIVLGINHLAASIRKPSSIHTLMVPVHVAMIGMLSRAIRGARI